MPRFASVAIGKPHFYFLLTLPFHIGVSAVANENIHGHQGLRTANTQGNIVKKTIYLAAVAAFALPTAASAQGYVQIQTGIDSVKVAGESDEGLAYGIAAGYDFSLSDSMFVGIEGSIDDSTTKECASDLIVVGDETCIKTGRDLSAVVRLGTKLGENSKLYVLGGYTNARLKVTYSDGVSTTSDGANGDGFRLGAGYQHDFGSNMFAKVEYRYSNYESDISRHNGIVAVGLRF